MDCGCLQSIVQWTAYLCSPCLHGLHRCAVHYQHGLQICAVHASMDCTDMQSIVSMDCSPSMDFGCISQVPFEEALVADHSGFGSQGCCQGVTDEQMRAQTCYDFWAQQVREGRPQAPPTVIEWLQLRLSSMVSFRDTPLAQKVPDLLRKSQTRTRPPHTQARTHTLPLPLPPPQKSLCV